VSYTFRGDIFKDDIDEEDDDDDGVGIHGGGGV
jgi:hypothetical protein